MPATVTFQVGTTYYARSFADHDCVWQFEVISRTAKTVTLREDGQTGVSRRTVRVWNGVETVNPFGTYSMSPILAADKVAVAA